MHVKRLVKRLELAVKENTINLAGRATQRREEKSHPSEMAPAKDLTKDGARERRKRGKKTREKAKDFTAL